MACTVPEAKFHRLTLKSWNLQENIFGEKAKKPHNGPNMHNSHSKFWGRKTKQKKKK